MGKPRPYTKPIASSRKSSAGSLFYTIIAFALVGGAIYYTSREPAAPPIINPPANPIPEPTPPDNSLNIHTIPESRLQPETQPETPETRPVPQPETPETEPETPETPPETQPESTFDTDEFLKRARTIMVDRAKPTIAASHKEIDRNLTAYGLDIIYLIRQFSQKSDRDIAEAQLKEFMSDCRDDGSRIPLEPDFEIEGKFLDLHNVYLQKQEDIDAKLIQQITELSRTYILGIELQISRLDATLDAKPIETLKQEIEDTRKDPDSFVAMILEDD